MPKAKRLPGFDYSYLQVNRSDSYHDLFNTTKLALISSDIAVEEMKYERSAVLDSDRSFWFLMFLACGKENSSWFLSDCIVRGIGMGQGIDPDLLQKLSDLSLVIGKNLGDKDCESVIASDPIEDEEILNCASYCAKQIQMNKAEVEDLIEKKTLTTQDMISCTMSVDRIVKELSGHSYIENMCQDGIFIGLTKEIELIGDDLVVLAGDHITPESACCIIS